MLRLRPPPTFWRIGPKGARSNSKDKPRKIGEVAKLLNVTTDRLRNWERNGLIEVPRNPLNGYRFYRTREIGRLRVIRTLSQARYSQMAILRMLMRLDQGETEDLYVLHSIRLVKMKMFSLPLISYFPHLRS